MIKDALFFASSNKVLASISAPSIMLLLFSSRTFLISMSSSVAFVLEFFFVSHYYFHGLVDFIQ